MMKLSTNASQKLWYEKYIFYKSKNLFLNKWTIGEFIVFVLGVVVLLVTIAINLAYDFIIGEKPYDELFNIFGPGSEFLYFTNQSNLILGAAMIIVSIIKKKWSFNVFFASVVWISITFVIYWILISYRSNWSEFLSAFRSILAHAVFPIFGFFCLFLMRKRIIVTRITRIIISAYLTAYYLFIIIIFFATLNNEILLEIKSKNVGSADYDKFGNAVLIYEFASPINPLFIKLGETPSNVFARIVLNIIMAIIMAIIPVLFTLFWMKIYKINHNKFFVKINQPNSKKFKIKFIKIKDVVTKY